MRSKPPSVDFYYGDFYDGVIEMTAILRGMYISALCRIWSKGMVCNSAKSLPLVLGVTQQEFDENWPEFVKILEPIEEDGRILGWTHVRAQAEMDKKISVLAARSENGKKGGRPRGKAKVLVSLKLNHKLNKANGKKEVGSRKKEVIKEKEVEIPEKFAQSAKFMEEWGNWIDWRREKKMPITHRALSRHLKVIAECTPREAVDVIDAALAGEWKSLHLLKEPSGNGKLTDDTNDSEEWSKTLKI